MVEGKWVWDRYWRADRLASCFDSDGSNYPRAFFEEWRRFFETLPEDANVLDLCTGNGAIARMAAEFSRKNQLAFDITGVDQAAIDPERFTARTPGQGAISFVGEVAAESLPFPDDEFAAVTSQYGIEYTDLEKTVPEIARVLENEGKVQLLCHSEEAVQTQRGREELARLETVIEHIGLFEAAAEATEAVWKAEHGQGQVELAREVLKTFQDNLNTVARLARETPDNPFLVNTYGLLRHTFDVRSHFDLETLLAKIEDARTEALAHRSRVQALVDAALGETDRKKLAELFTGEGFKPVEIKPAFLEKEAKEVGVVFQLERLA